MRGVMGSMEEWEEPEQEAQELWKYASVAVL